MIAPALITEMPMNTVMNCPHDWVQWNTDPQVGANEVQKPTEVTDTYIS